MGGTLAIGHGGTGQATALAAIDALLPSQASNSGKFLTTNGTDPSWATAGGAFVRAATKIIAASNSVDTTDADYVCTGTNDHTTINTAIAALPTGGGRIVLLEGNYNISAPIEMNKSNITLEGQGMGTNLKLVASTSSTGGIVQGVSFINGGTGYTVNDVLTLTLPGVSFPAQVTVTSVSSGVITGISLSQQGNVYTKGITYATTGGTGSGATIKVTDVATEIIVLGNGTVLQSNCAIKNIYFDGNGANQAGTTFRGLIESGDWVSFGSSYTLIDNCYFLNAYGAAIQDYSANEGIAINCTFDNCIGTNAETIADSFSIISSCQFFSSQTKSGLIQAVASEIVSNCYFNLATGYNGTVISALNVTSNTILSDTPGANFIGITSGLFGKLSNNVVKCINGTPNAGSIGIKLGIYAVCGNNIISTFGIGINCTGQGATISGNFIYGISTNSIQLNGNSLITISGNEINNNGQLAANNTYSGIQITSGGNYNVITGNIFQSAGVTNGFKYCIEEQTGAGPTIITNNVATTAQTAQIHTTNVNTINANNLTA